MKWCLLLLSIVLLPACATKSVVISEPEIIDRPTLSCPKAPAHLLRPCTILSLPSVGIKWSDTIEIIKVKDLQQHSCNERFTIISEWQDANIGQ